MAKCECLLHIGLVSLTLLATSLAWKCLYEEFNLDPKKMQGGWYVYGTYPDKIPMCYFANLDLYWTRITFTDYTTFAVELHCSLPWMRPQFVIYTRDKKPSDDILKEVDTYLVKVNLKRDQFVLIKKAKGCKDAKHGPLQRWHLSNYNHLDYNPHYIKPLAQNPNI